ncbi:MAG TPA: HAMP domain-containing sensor histidine kinase [Nevskia sp.]|nr:HAMP domain-containing sensor histidine kinase [Rudaea sp.]HET7797281.1 HAMP domain-containing sensor histidine kinase [Nevskia sp.]
MRRLGLRARVAALCAVLGLVVSACLSAVAVHFSDSYVHRLIDEMLRVEGDYLRERYAADGVVPHPRTKHYYAFVGGAGASAGDPAPPDFINLGPGLHEVADARGERHVAVYDVNGERLYVVLDIGLESVRERRLSRDLFALMLFGSALSAWLGWFLSGRAIEPVRRLAHQVETLDPAVHGTAPLAPEYSRDEVGVLAQAFDRYQQKLHEYVRRERTFTADASHELRTPLAVIRGAIEVLLDNGGTSAAIAVRLKRMQRGADELRDLLDALLVLARSDERANEDRTPDLGALVDSLLRERADALAEKHLRLEGHREAAVAVAAPPRVLGIVIGNLLRAATQFAEGGVLRVQVAADALTVAHEGDAAAADGAETPARIDTREHVLGLGMIRRVCERRGWLLDESVDAGGRAFVLRFG